MVFPGEPGKCVWPLIPCQVISRTRFGEEVAWKLLGSERGYSGPPDSSVVYLSGRYLQADCLDGTWDLRNVDMLTQLVCWIELENFWMQLRNPSG